MSSPRVREPRARGLAHNFSLSTDSRTESKTYNHLRRRITQPAPRRRARARPASGRAGRAAPPPPAPPRRSSRATFSWLSAAALCSGASPSASCSVAHARAASSADDRLVAAEGGAVQRGRAAARGGVDGGAVAEQQRDAAGVAVARGVVQRREAARAARAVAAQRARPRSAPAVSRAAPRRPPAPRCRRRANSSSPRFCSRPVAGGALADAADRALPALEEAGGGPRGARRRGRAAIARARASLRGKRGARQLRIELWSLSPETPPA